MENSKKYKYQVTMKLMYMNLTVDYRNNPCATYSGDTTIIGIFDSLEDACIQGNKKLAVLESKYGLIGSSQQLDSSTNDASRLPTITETGYLETPFNFYLEIETLDFTPFETILSTAEEEINRYDNSDYNCI